MEVVVVMCRSNPDDSPGICSGVEKLIATAIRRHPAPSKAASIRFAASVIATLGTWERFRGVKQLQVWQVFALHHFLDPDLLALSRPGRFKFVRRAASELTPESPLRRFMEELPMVLRDAGEGRLRCVGESIKSLERSTDPKSFLAYARDTGMRAEPREGMLMPALPRAFFSSRLLVAHDTIWQLLVPESEGGGGKPGVSILHDDLKDYIIKSGQTPWVAQGIARAIRPDNAPRGRPRRKARRT